MRIQVGFITPEGERGMPDSRVARYTTSGPYNRGDLFNAADKHLVDFLLGANGRRAAKDAITKRSVWSELHDDAPWGGHDTPALTRTVMVRVWASKPPMPMYQDIIFD